MEIAMEVPQKVKTEGPYDPAVPILGAPQRIEVSIQHRFSHTSVYFIF
jgi:hypothetical protein